MDETYKALFNVRVLKGSQINIPQAHRKDFLIEMGVCGFICYAGEW